MLKIEMKENAYICTPIIEKKSCPDIACIFFDESTASDFVRKYQSNPVLAIFAYQATAWA